MILPSGLGARRPVRRKPADDSAPAETHKTTANPAQDTENGQLDHGEPETGSEVEIGEGPQDGDQPEHARPPKHGPGASAKAWAEYAESVGLDPSGKTRAEIIELVEGSDNG